MMFVSVQGDAAAAHASSIPKQDDMLGCKNGVTDACGSSGVALLSRALRAVDFGPLEYWGLAREIGVL
jgi:hypothetical protein